MIFLQYWVLNNSLVSPRRWAMSCFQNAYALINPIVLAVCDELLLGIPHKAWWVAILVLLCIGFAFIVPSFLPTNLLQGTQSPRVDRSVAKVS